MGTGPPCGGAGRGDGAEGAQIQGRVAITPTYTGLRHGRPKSALGLPKLPKPWATITPVAGVRGPAQITPGLKICFLYGFSRFYGSLRPMPLEDPRSLASTLQRSVPRACPLNYAMASAKSALGLSKLSKLQAWDRIGNRPLEGANTTMSIRSIRRLAKAQPTLEGAGVRLARAFGFEDPTEFDPFLLLDDFRNDRPEDYLAGFPWHPHRGIETITYVLSGTVEHGDSLGNHDHIGPGDIQWMTAGSGIVHQEMPKGDDQGRMHGFQLWANLPSSLKMTAPRYQGIRAADIPTVIDDDGSLARVVCGQFWGKRGPVDGIAADPVYVDLSIPAGQRKVIPIETTRHAFAYVFEGSGTFRDASQPQRMPTDWVGGAGPSDATAAENRSLILFDRGDEIIVQAGEKGIRFLLVSGQPLREPVAWQGPIVMNTQEELQQASEDLQQGTFLKTTSP